VGGNRVSRLGQQSDSLLDSKLSACAVQRLLFLSETFVRRGTQVLCRFKKLFNLSCINGISDDSSTGQQRHYAPFDLSESTFDEKSFRAICRFKSQLASAQSPHQWSATRQNADLAIKQWKLHAGDRFVQKSRFWSDENQL